MQYMFRLLPLFSCKYLTGSIDEANHNNISIAYLDVGQLFATY